MLEQILVPLDGSKLSAQIQVHRLLTPWNGRS
jgi:hypothetical protein